MHAPRAAGEKLIMPALRLSIPGVLLVSLLGVSSQAADRAMVASTGSATPSASTLSGDVVAQAGALSMAGGDVRHLIATLPPSQRAAATHDLNSLEQFVRAELVRRAVLSQAKTKDFEQRPDTVAALDRARDEALVRLWVVSQAQVPADYPSESDIKAAYEANTRALTSPTQYRLAQIFISAPDGADPAKLTAALRKANDIEAKIAKSDFSQLAREQSEHAESASRGGDMGYLPDNRMAPEIVTVVRGMKEGEVVGPVKSAQGLHFFKLLDKKPGVVPTLAEAHDTLSAALRTRRAQELERAYLSGLNDKLGVTVNQIELAKLQPTLKTLQ
jgi:parvulin-like peptidyl-prolyl isomerase